jgi:hypothetical protein
MNGFIQATHFCDYPAVQENHLQIYFVASP